ncbi:hypothetical protein GWL_23250 [Herbaspirillum sp. GW103]|jgi:hypothetical protein|nr:MULTISPECIES: hypothetical protein [unclassified Herbaspirillum]EIJ48083.1 hypothetical protein GWL_23250 [Herbaspirillum sp. GW103]
MAGLHKASQAPDSAHKKGIHHRADAFFSSVSGYRARFSCATE